MRRLRSARRRREGYTLVELMMVVMIIATSVLAFAPSFGKAMADRRVSTAARELIRIGRRARSDTFGYLRAHLLWVQPSAGRIQLLRGPTQSCTTAAWESIVNDCTATPVGARCLEDVSLTTWGRGKGIALREETLNGNNAAYNATSRAICFAPSGQVFLGKDDGLAAAHGKLSDANTVKGGVVFTIHSGASDPDPEAGDLVHRVLFPLGSTPRALR